MTTPAATPVTFKPAKISAKRHWSVEAAYWVTNKETGSLLGKVTKSMNHTRTGSDWSAETVMGRSAGHAYETRAAAAQALVAARVALEAERAAQ